MQLFFKELIKPLYIHIKTIFMDYKWRKQNKHNKTRAKSIFTLNKVCVGRYTYGDLYIHDYRTKDEKLEIGDFCSIGPNVHFYLGGEHNYKVVTTFPIKSFFSHEWEAKTKGKIQIEDDVWIGNNVIILSGVTVGQGSVIGAGSIVTKNIPPYSIYCGTKVIKRRFSPEIVEKMKKVKFSLLTENIIKENLDIMYNIDDFIDSELYLNLTKDIEKNNI